MLVCMSFSRWTMLSESNRETRTILLSSFMSVFIYSMQDFSEHVNRSSACFIILETIRLRLAIRTESVLQLHRLFRFNAKEAVRYKQDNSNNGNLNHPVSSRLAHIEHAELVHDLN